MNSLFSVVRLPANVPLARFGGQGLQPVQQVGNVAQAAIDDLQSAGTVGGVDNALLQFGDVGLQLIRDRQTGGIVARAVNTIAGRQLLNGVAFKIAVLIQLLLARTAT